MIWIYTCFRGARNGWNKIYADEACCALNPEFFITDDPHEHAHADRSLEFYQFVDQHFSYIYIYYRTCLPQ